MKKTVITRVSALALGLAVFFSTAVPSYAATVAVDIRANIDMSIEVRYADNSYTIVNTGDIGQTPLNDPADDYPSDAPPVSSKPVQFVRVQTDLTGYVTGKQVQLHVVYRLVTPSAKNSLVTIGVNSATRNGGTWTALPHTIVSSQFGQDPVTGSAYMDVILQFTIPVESEVLRVYGTFNTDPFTPQNLGDIVGGVQTCQFLYLDSVTDQDSVDKDKVDNVDGTVSDKTDTSDELLGEIDSLEKPDVNVDPMQGIDVNAFNAFTSVLAIPFENAHITWLFATLLAMCLIAYVLFGKGG